MEPAPTATAQSALHVVCFEEAGDCALERIAREARPGDAVLALGPESLVLRLRALGLPDGVAVERCGRSGGRTWPGLERSIAQAKVRLGTREAGVEAPVRAHGIAHFIADVIAYGPRARRLVPEARPAALPLLPPEPAAWSAERRARVRRELGLAPSDFALLAAGDPPEWIELSFASRACAMARVGGAPVRLVVSPRAPRIAEASRFFEQAAAGKAIVVDERADRPWELLPALDGLVLDADGAATQTVACAGWRAAGTAMPQQMSALPALWAIACGRPACVHRGIDLGSLGDDPLIDRFDIDVAELARALHSRASSASAASR